MLHFDDTFSNQDDASRVVRPMSHQCSFWLNLLKTIINQLKEPYMRVSEDTQWHVSRFLHLVLSLKKNSAGSEILTEFKCWKTFAAPLSDKPQMNWKTLPMVSHFSKVSTSCSIPPRFPPGRHVYVMYHAVMNSWTLLWIKDTIPAGRWISAQAEPMDANGQLITLEQMVLQNTF